MESGAHHSGDTQAVNDPTSVEPGWRMALRHAITSPAVLAERLGLSAELVAAAAKPRQLFPMLVTESFADRMERGNPFDPLLLQVWPQAREAEEQPGFTADPVDELGCSVAPGLLQKYHSRALLVTTQACAVHCRYCFRRHYPYGDQARGRGWWREAVAHIATDPTVQEVILSGGDPLTLGDDQLADIAAALSAIPHVQRLRIHSRLPVVLPQRVDGRLVQWIAGTRLSVVIVVHANHAAEINNEVIAACQRLRQAGALLLNQTVYLAGVNDSVAALRDLSEALIVAEVLPYYLHAFDPVAGAAHFAVPDQQIQDVVAQLATQVSGYMVPRLVREVPGAAAKVPLDLRLPE